MSGGLDILSLKEDDVTKMLSATTHIGSDNVGFQMEQYVYKRRADGKFLICWYIYYYIHLLIFLAVAQKGS